MSMISHRRFRNRLLLAGIAPGRVRRYLAELDDHLVDLIEEEKRSGRSEETVQATALARLGSLDDLATSMTECPGLRTWTARAPWAVLPLGSISLLAGLYALSALLVWGVVIRFGDTIDGCLMPPNWLSPIAGTVFDVDQYVIPILIGWGVGAAAIRQRLNLAWPMIAMILVAFVGAGLFIDADWPSAPRHWTLRVGSPFDDQQTPVTWGRFILAFAVNLVLTTLPVAVLCMRARNSEDEA